MKSNERSNGIPAGLYGLRYIECRSGSRTILKRRAFPAEDSVHLRKARCRSFKQLDTDHDIDSTIPTNCNCRFARKSINWDASAEFGRDERCWCHGVMSPESRSGQLFGTGKGPPGRLRSRLVNRTGREKSGSGKMKKGKGESYWIREKERE